MTASMLANHLWQSTIVAGIAWLMTMALRRNRAGTRYGVWLAASLKFLVPFTLLVSAGSQLGWRTAPIARQPQVAFVLDAIGQPFSAATDAIVSAAPAAPAFAAADVTRMWVGLLLAIWIGGAAAVSIVWCIHWRRVSAIVNAGTRVAGGPVLDALRRVEARSGINTPLALAVSDTRLEPGVFGIVRPVLLWPRQISVHLVEAQIEAIIAHEIAHVRRRDNLAAAAHMLVQAVFWFHPIVWWVGARLVDERERACDEEVVGLGSDPQTYAESILKTCQFFVESPLACVAGVTGSDLKKRIEHIMVNDVRASLNVWKRTLLAMAVAAAIAGPIAVGALNAPRLRAQTVAADDRTALEKEIQTRLADIHERDSKAELAGRSQSPATIVAVKPAFDVTSVKPNNSGDGRIGVLPGPNGGLNATNVTLGMLIRLSHQLQDNQIVGGPKWLFSDRFDVLGSGTAPGREGAMFPKLQTLLADRFSLVTHTEKRELPMFALVLAGRDGKIGPKMQTSTAGDCPSPSGPGGARGNPPTAAPMSPAQMQRCGIIFGPGRLSGGNLSMAQLATNLSRIVGSMVVDKTNLAGNFELTLEYALDPNMGGRSDFQGLPPPLAPERPSTDRPSIFSALQEQLGLKLESTKGPVEVLVIDSVEKPTPD
jgi:bla regulator protein BlaR1